MKPNIRIEHSTRPWFGSRKRARKLLENRKRLIEPERALNVLLSLLKAHARSVQQVRFIEFRHKKEGKFRYTIFLVWIRSDSYARQAVYETAEEVVRRTLTELPSNVKSCLFHNYPARLRKFNKEFQQSCLIVDSHAIYLA